MLKYILFFLMSSGVIILASCDSSERKPLNPNGDSELALLMRKMYDESLAVKKALVNGEEIPDDMDHKSILTADATEPEKVAGMVYKSFANYYLGVLQELKSAESRAEQMRSYKTLVTACSSCHQSLCPGPLVRIKKLEIE